MFPSTQTSPLAPPSPPPPPLPAINQLAKVDTDANPSIAQAMQISSLPTVFGVKGGKVISQFVGLPQQHDLDDFVEKLLEEDDEDDDE